MPVPVNGTAPEAVKPQVDNTFVKPGKAAEAFLRAARRKERKESGFELASRFREMSDEEFDKGVANGTITPEQIKAAGEYQYDVFMGDVWAEDPDNDGKEEPSYEEFMSQPEKYGYTEWEGEEAQKLYRYKPDRYSSTNPSTPKKSVK